MKTQNTLPNEYMYRSRNLEEEVKWRESCVKFNQEIVDNYRTFYRWVGKPSIVYLALRAIGHFGGFEINRDLEHSLLGLVDMSAMIGFIAGGYCMKASEFLAGFDLRSAQRKLEEVRSRSELEEGK